MRKNFKLTLVALSLLALTACSAEHEINIPAPQGDEISFGTVNTRVDSASEINEFSVWATVSSIGSNAVSYQPLLTNERVYRNPAGSNTWAYDNVQRWLPNSIFHFFAAYPYNIGFEEQRQQLGDTWYTSYTLNVTANGSDDTVDILTAQNVTNTNTNGYSTTVPLTFSHLLTKFNLTISQNTDIDDNFEYYITKVIITGLNGTCAYVVIPFGETFYTSWNTSEATPMTLGKNYESPVCLREDYGDNRKSKPLKVWGNDGVMLIPHDIAANGVKVTIEYLYDVKLDDDSLGSPRSVTGFIPAIKWASSTAVNYNISIADTNEIEFDQPTIEPWGSPQTGGTIIIK